MAKYIPIINDNVLPLEIEMTPNFSDNNTFLSKIRKNRETSIINEKNIADEYYNKYLSKPIYDNLDILNKDVAIIISIIEKESFKANMFSLTLDIIKLTTINGLSKLWKIWNDCYIKTNKLFKKKYWLYVSNTIEILVGSVIQRTGIERQNELPKRINNGYEPNQGIYLKKEFPYTLTIWF